MRNAELQINCHTFLFHIARHSSDRIQITNVSFHLTYDSHFIVEFRTDFRFEWIFRFSYCDSIHHIITISQYQLWNCHNLKSNITFLASEMSKHRMAKRTHFIWETDRSQNIMSHNFLLLFIRIQIYLFSTLSIEFLILNTATESLRSVSNWLILLCKLTRPILFCVFVRCSRSLYINKWVTIGQCCEIHIYSSDSGFNEPKKPNKLHIFYRIIDINLWLYFCDNHWKLSGLGQLPKSLLLRSNIVFF